MQLKQINYKTMIYLYQIIKFFIEKFIFYINDYNNNYNIYIYYFIYSKDMK